MSKETTQKGKLGDLQRLLASMTSNSGDLAHLEPARSRFAELLAKAQEAFDRQALHTAAKQEATQELRGFISQAQRMANILRLGVKQNYGIRSEKLAEFGLQPFRGRKAKPDDEEPKSPPAESNPPEPADPARD
jgi:hypothetical protein